jgi:RND family efflux transporter MFP subunit
MAKHRMNEIINIGLKAVIPLVILAIAAVGAYTMIMTKPVAHKKAPEVPVPVVEVTYLKPENSRIWTEAMGTVEPAREINLGSQVSGKIISVSSSFIPGGLFKKGQEILRIDPIDYELAVKQQQAVVTEAEYNLKIELGHQKVAGREWKLLGESTGKAGSGSSDLALRKPHLEKARADLESARSKLRAANIDLSRTRIKAPFSAQVVSRSVDLGSIVSSQQTLAHLVGTDEAWILATVPVDRLRRISFPDNESGLKGSDVEIAVNGENTFSDKHGEVVRLLPSLEEKGRMSRVIISVADPFNLDRVKNIPKLLLDSYVRVRIDSGVLENVYVIPRDAFRDNNTVWIMKPDNTLEVRKVDSVWRDSKYIYVKKRLNPGERLVLTDIPAPLEGMKLRESESLAARNHNG